jgi:putative addiction module killer protein
MNHIIEGSKKLVELASYWGSTLKHIARRDWDGLAENRYSGFLARVNPCSSPMYLPEPSWLRKLAGKAAIPLALEGLAGDLEAQRRYEQIAPTNFSSLPEWGKERVDFLVNGLVARAPFSTRFALDDQRWVTLGVGARDTFVKELRDGSYRTRWLDWFSTFSEAKALVARFDELQTKDTVLREELSRVIAITNQEELQRELWRLCGLNTTAHGPIAQASKLFMRNVVPLMFKIRLIDDILSNHQITLSREGYSTLLSSGATAWELFASREIRNLLQAVAFIDEQAVEIQADARSKAVEAAMRSKAPFRSVRQSLKLPEPATTPVTKGEAEPVLPAREVAALSARRVIFGQLSELKGEHDCRALARKLAKLYAHGHCTLSEITDGLSKKNDPEDLVEELYLKSSHQRLAKEAIDRLSPAPEAAPTSFLKSTADYGITLERCKPFENWLGSLDKKFAARVEARLYRVAEGNMGDYRHLRENLCELRIHEGPGIRIYLAQSGKNNWSVLLGGVKQTQDDDIARALSLLS